MAAQPPPSKRRRAAAAAIDLTGSDDDDDDAGPAPSLHHRTAGDAAFAAWLSQQEQGHGLASPAGDAALAARMQKRECRSASASAASDAALAARLDQRDRSGGASASSSADLMAARFQQEEDASAQALSVEVAARLQQEDDASAHARSAELAAHLQQEEDNAGGEGGLVFRRRSYSSRRQGAPITSYSKVCLVVRCKELCVARIPGCTAPPGHITAYLAYASDLGRSITAEELAAVKAIVEQTQARRESFWFAHKGERIDPTGALVRFRSEVARRWAESSGPLTGAALRPCSTRTAPWDSTRTSL